MIMQKSLLYISIIALLSACTDGDEPNDASNTSNTTDAAALVTAPPPQIVSQLSLDTDFYKQYIDVDGLSIVASFSASPYALLETRWTIRKMLVNRPDLITAIASTNTRFSIMAVDEFTTDIPEHSDLVPADYWDRRARGLGATSERPAVSAGEENILQLPGDPYSTESILVHEFAHAIHQQGMNTIDSEFESRLISTYDQAMNDNLWQGTYAASNPSEYFAEGVQSWFGTNRENDGEHNNIDTREELVAYDIRLATLIEQVFGDNQWQYQGPTNRQDEKEHLAGYDSSEAGEFSWPDSLSQVDISNGSGSELNLPSLPNVLDEDWSTIASPSSEVSSRIDFFNNTGDTIRVSWLDTNGQRRDDDTGLVLLANTTAALNTFEGHLFEVFAADDVTVIARFRATALPSLATIE